jgi:hypothetical protein
MSRPVRAGLVLGWLLRVEHRLAFTPGVGGGDALLGPEGAGHGVFLRGSLVGRDLGRRAGRSSSAGMTVPASKCLALVSAGGGVTGVSVGCVCSLLVNCIVDVSIFICAFFVRIPDGLPFGWVLMGVCRKFLRAYGGCLGIRSR